MEKKDDIILIIAKALSKNKQKLTPKEIKICKDLSAIKLVKDYGLNDIQANEVIKWCVTCCSIDDLENKVLEEGIFSFLDRFKKNKVEKVFKDLMHPKSNSLAIFNFLRDVSMLNKIIFREKGIKDYRTTSRNHEPKHDPNIQRINKIIKMLTIFQKEFDSISKRTDNVVVKSARRVSESFEIKEVDQKSATLNISNKLNRITDNPYYTRDLMLGIRPYLRSVGNHYKLNRKERKELAARFANLTQQLLSTLKEELHKYMNAVEHGVLSLDREANKPMRIE